MENGDGEDFFKSFVNKRVIVVMMDGYKKRGLVSSANSHFLTLVYLSGREEMLNYDAIKSIQLDV
jgi:small nuclear ribonucleoprotein (snRNP)-like protein